MEELLSMRKDEVVAFRDALKDGTDAVNVICQDIVFMAKFYNENKIPLQLVQVKEPELSVGPDSTRDKFSKIGSQWRVWLQHCHPAAT